MTCPLCSSPLAPTRKQWLRYCNPCRFWGSTLWDEAKWQRKASALDEAHREPGIKSLRIHNFQRILSKLEKLATKLSLTDTTSHTKATNSDSGQKGGIRGIFRGASERIRQSKFLSYGATSASKKSEASRPPGQLPTSLKGRTICDIGCGYGWFLQVAQSSGMIATGIEPEPRIADAAKGDGYEIITGCFPECLQSHQQFDYLIFNDVLEHLPDINLSIVACHHHLKPDGILVINIPSSNGFFYKTANLLDQFGISGPFERMWQKNFHSPHLSYFNSSNLNKLVEGKGFKLIDQSSLVTIEKNGLKERLLMDANTSKIKGAVMYLALRIAYPIISNMQSDIILHIYQRTE